MLAQLRKSVTGPGTVSDKDMAILQQAAVGDIKLDRGTITEVLGSIERLNLRAAVQHQQNLLTYTGDDPTDMRIVFNGYGLPMEQIVPDAAIRKLREHADDPVALAAFNRTFSTPGLAQKVLSGNRGR